MHYPLVIVGGFLLVAGSVIFIIDCFKVHFLWGLSAIFLPIVSLICLFKHWSETKRGFLVSLLAWPLLLGAFLLMPKADAKVTAGQPEKSKDPFLSVMQRARDTVTKVQESRKDVVPSAAVGATPAPTVLAKNTATQPPAPASTVAQRLAINRAAFKSMESEFAELNKKRSALSKNDSKAIGAFNLEAKNYADKLAAARAEQAVLLELQNRSVK